jgi:hypothetical protein
MRTEAQQVSRMQGDRRGFKRWLVSCGGLSLQAHACLSVSVYAEYSAVELGRCACNTPADVSILADILDFSTSSILRPMPTPTRRLIGLLV